MSAPNVRVNDRDRRGLTALPSHEDPTVLRWQRVREDADVQLVQPDAIRVPGARTHFMVRPGVLDASARQAFTNGQCVAFAAAYARRTGAATINLMIRTEDQSIIHAYVEKDYATMVDVCGESDIADWADERGLDEAYGDDGYDYETVYLEDVRDIQASSFGAGLPAQNWDLAETMMDAFEVQLARS